LQKELLSNERTAYFVIKFNKRRQKKPNIWNVSDTYHLADTNKPKKNKRLRRPHSQKSARFYRYYED